MILSRFKKKKSYKVVIIGGGPSGSYFYSKILNHFSNENSILIDKYGVLCKKISKFGLFFENNKANTPKSYRFLINGTKTGNDISKYFKSKFDSTFNAIKFNVVCIKKVKNNFEILDNLGNSIFTNQVVLATGLKKRKLNIKIKPTSNITNKKMATILKRTNLNFQEIIFIGSGDNAAFKAIKICKVIFNKSHKEKCVKIFARSNFYKNIKPAFLKEIKFYIKNKILEVFIINSELEKFNYNKFNFIKKIKFNNFNYTSSFSNGAIVNIQIGYTPEIPSMVNCSLKDFLLVGDLSLWYKKNVVSLYGSIDDAKKKAIFFIKNNKLNQ